MVVGPDGHHRRDGSVFCPLASGPLGSIANRYANVFDKAALTFVVTVWLAASLSFFTLLIVPGNPARIILGFDANPAALTALEQRLGLHLPPLARYGQWLTDLARFDLGKSLIYDVPGAQLIGERLQVTLPLAALATFVALAIGVPLGLLAARTQGRWTDWVIGVFAQLGVATPSFWLGMFLIVLFAVRWQWLPAGGFVPWTTDPVASLRSLLLPAIPWDSPGHGPHPHRPRLSLGRACRGLRPHRPC